MEEAIQPKFKNKTGICLSCNEGFVKILCVALKSIVLNSSDKNTYDIVILTTDICEKSQEMLKKICNRKNFSIRFLDLSDTLQNIDKEMFYLSDRYKIYTYYRFFISDIFKNYEKIVYIDADEIIQDDIAKLYNIDFEDNCLIATHDLYMQILIAYNIGEYYDYLKNDLNMENPYNYFQAGVLVFNIKQCSSNNITEKLFKKLQEIKTPRIVDQDIMNCVFENKVKFINNDWDVDLNITKLIKRTGYEKISKDTLESFNSAYKNSKILHYAGEIKPWTHVFMPKSNVFWRYALTTPVFGVLISDILAKEVRKLNLLYICRK